MNLKVAKFTKLDILRLKYWYTFIGDTQIAIMLNEINETDKFTKKSIEKKRSYLKLKRTKDQIKLIMSDNAIISNLKVKEFETTIQKYHRFIKIDNKLISYSRWIYEKNKGKIPEGMIIFYKDFDSLNDNLDNLEIRERGGFKLKDFTIGLNLIEYRINKVKQQNLMNWYKMTFDEQSELMKFLSRLLKIKERLESNINNMINRNKKNKCESGYYEPIEAF